MKIDREKFQAFRHSGMTAQPHGPVTRAFHWLGGTLLAYAFIENGERTRVLFSPAAMHRDVILGVILAAVFLARPIWVYFFRGGARLPTDAPRWEKFLAWVSHASIYGSLAAILVSGFMIAYLTPGSHIFRARRRLRTDNPLLTRTIRFHASVADFLLFLIYMHIAIAMWHWFFREDGVWESMTGRSLDRIKNSLKARIVGGLPKESLHE